MEEIPVVHTPVKLTTPSVMALDMRPNVTVHLDRDPNDPRVIRKNREILTAIKAPVEDYRRVPVELNKNKEKLL